MINSPPKRSLASNDRWSEEDDCNEAMKPLESGMSSTLLLLSTYLLLLPSILGVYYVRILRE